MAVTQARLNRYRADLDSYGDAAALYVEQLLNELLEEEPDATVAEVRDAAIDAIDGALSAFGDQASELALDLFEEIVGDGYDTRIYDVIDAEAVDSKVRYLARSLVEGNSAAFTGDVSDLSRYYVKRSAFENMVENCERNDVRYARVPSGRETCAFCYMLSSRGFVYHTAESAGEGHPYHRNCDCVIVPGYEGIPASEQIEGYDPDEMRERWQNCADTVGIDPDTKDEGELAEIRREVSTRDFRWLNTGELPAVEYETGADPKPKEVTAAGWLSSNGFRVTFRATRETEALKTSDIFIDDATWEIKQPQGNGKNNINNQFNEAKGQSDKLIIDASISPFGFDGVVERAAEALLRRTDFTEVLVIDGQRVRRIEKAR